MLSKSANKNQPAPKLFGGGFFNYPSQRLLKLKYTLGKQLGYVKILRAMLLALLAAYAGARLP